MIPENVKTLETPSGSRTSTLRAQRDGEEARLRPAFDPLLAAWWWEFPDGDGLSIEWPNGRVL